MVSLHGKYAAQGFQIFAFPCNQFGKQEPGSPAEIAKFAADRGVKFQMMEKIDVNGANEDPVYTFLKEQTGGEPKIGWNFGAYYLVDKAGGVTGHSCSPAQLEDKVAAALA